MSVIRKIKVKDRNGNFNDKDLGSLAINVKYNSVNYNENGELNEPVVTNVQTILNQCQFDIFSLIQSTNSNINNIENAFENITDIRDEVSNLDNSINTINTSITNINNSISNLPKWDSLNTAIKENGNIQLILCEFIFDNSKMPSILFQNFNGLSTREIHFTKLNNSIKEEVFATIQLSLSNQNNPITITDSIVYLTDLTTNTITKSDGGNLINLSTAYAYYNTPTTIR